MKAAIKNLIDFVNNKSNNFDEIGQYTVHFVSEHGPALMELVQANVGDVRIFDGVLWRPFPVDNANVVSLVIDGFKYRESQPKTNEADDAIPR